MNLTTENRVALIHRVIISDDESPKEYAILVTDKRSIFIHQKQTRSTFVLRGEMKYGTALVTDVVPKTLADYESTSLDSLSNDTSNLTISHDTVISMKMGKEEPKFQARDFFIWLTMRRQKEVFQVYYFEMTYLEHLNNQTQIRFYLVLLGAYFKPRRQTQSRETILREYAMDAFQIYQKFLPVEIERTNEKK